MPRKIVTCFPLRFEDKCNLLHDYRSALADDLTGTNDGYRLLRDYTCAFLSAYEQLDDGQRAALAAQLRADTRPTVSFDAFLNDLFADLPEPQTDAIPDHEYADAFFDTEEPDEIVFGEETFEDDGFNGYGEDEHKHEDRFGGYEDEEYEESAADGHKSSGLLSKIKDFFYPEE